MHKVVCLKPDGGIRSFDMNHKKVNLFFDNEEYEICGAIDEECIIALGYSAKNKGENIFSIEYPNYFEKTYGDILLVGSDNDGEACDINLENIWKMFPKVVS